MKKILTLLSISAIIACTTNVSHAQRRATTNDNFQLNAEKKAANQNTQTTKNTNNLTPANTSYSATTAYAKLKERKVIAENQIDQLFNTMPTLKGAQAKKAVAQIELLQSEIQSITRQMALFPRSITDPNYVDQQAKLEKQLFQQELSDKTAALIAKDDPYAGKISADPELQQTYREYLNTFSPEQYTQQNAAGPITYRVMFSISTQPLSATTVNQMAPVLMQKLPSGGVAYYTGNFRTRSDAQNLCNRILANGKYRDAFVVAMSGNKRIPLQ